MRRGWPLVVVMLALAISTVALAVHPNPWPAELTPAPGPARAIGEYSAGCLKGAAALPLDGIGYQLMHPSRNRRFGHPALVQFIEALGRGVKKRGLGVVLIGDLSQPRGGRAPGGHASHQSGLDVDVWYWHPKNARAALLSPAERERISSRSVLNGKTQSIRSEWKAHVAGLLRIAGEQASVSRIFVHPLIKRELCASTEGDRAYLRKIRPWHGHDDHFHARLACPADSPTCKPQEPVAPGDGCDELGFWLDPKQAAERKKAQQTYQQTVVEGRGWPEECDALLTSSGGVEATDSKPERTKE